MLVGCSTTTSIKHVDDACTKNKGQTKTSGLAQSVIGLVGGIVLEDVTTGVASSRESHAQDKQPRRLQKVGRNWLLLIGSVAPPRVIQQREAVP
jgi:hypothetical protein